MSTMFADTLLIVFISVCTALLAEGITWVLVYRTDKYKRLKAEVEKQSKKLEKKKETITESAGRQQKKKIERQEEKLKNNNRDLSMVRMKSMFAIGFCFTALMGMFNSITSRRFLALPLRELPPSRPVDFLALRLLLGSSLEIKTNPRIPVFFFFRSSNQTGNYFVARATGSLSMWATF
ncbi:calcium load-activated calcium channel isoform X2 [Rhinolophus ferrumequinum]|uniref:calcium load-activated calcium channel isoform X2 n=1 Tax=Rhinolophus ferrumequinum TaxID=59479 RepID=UPI00140FB3E5|nr:calcium load-activated calcium channel isoform X2 [Rhinolophus ferrumequinum]